MLLGSKDMQPSLQAVSPQVTQVINPAVGLPLLSARTVSPAQLYSINTLASTEQYCLVTEVRQMCEQFAHSRSMKDMARS